VTDRPPRVWLEAIDAGEIVSRHGGTIVRRFELDGATFYAKEHRDRPVRREAEALRRLANRGVRAARVEALLPPPRPVLVTRGVPDARALSEILPALERRERRLAIVRVAALVRDLHGAGLSFPDLYTRHVLLDGSGTPHLVDVERLRAGSPPRRARDLAALDLTAEIAGASRTDRFAFLRAYAAGADLRPLTALVARARRKLERKRRFHRHRLIVRAAHREAFEGAGLASFRDFLESDAIESVRKLPDRENVRLVVGGRTYFGKRFDARHLLAARREWVRLVEFEREGLPGPEPAALGTDPVEGGFVYTAEVPGRPLDDLLREGAIASEEQPALARDLGALVRRMHELGFWHRDLYLCHVFAAREGGGWRLTLIDLARVGRKARPRRRWFVKDLAALRTSTPEGTVTPRAFVAFLRAYAGRRSRRLERRVARKAARMARHVPKTAIRCQGQDRRVRESSGNG
jgi:tRNA A-37 threonylcarbamoyl transferase component Bud32